MKECRTCGQEIRTPEFKAGDRVRFKVMSCNQQEMVVVHDDTMKAFRNTWPQVIERRAIGCVGLSNGQCYTPLPEQLERV